ncbi:MAG TPA: TonB family protein, partial [Pyrinomonadaceae bacterium]
RPERDGHLRVERPVNDFVGRRQRGCHIKSPLGQAVRLVAAQREVFAQGVVVVQVTVDETGGVTSAKAVSGHPLLQAAAVAAAKQAKFSPTLLSGKPVKVSGMLIYNFVLEQ